VASPESIRRSDHGLHRTIQLPPGLWIPDNPFGVSGMTVARAITQNKSNLNDLRASFKLSLNDFWFNKVTKLEVRLRAGSFVDA
jgi:hypothetical protein